MENEMQTIEQFVEDNGFSVSSVKVFENPYMNDRDMNHYQVKIKQRHNKDELVIFYSMGKGIQGKPTAEDVINCLASDSDVYEMEFDEFADMFGYSIDSISALKSYKQCKEQTQNLIDFIGKDLFTELAYSTERL